MASTFTTNKNIEKPGHNDYIDDWDVPVNANMDVIDACLGDVTTINLTAQASYTLTDADVQGAVLKFTGTLNSGAVPVKMPVGRGGSFTIINATTATDATSALTMSWSAGGTSYVVAQNATRMMYADGGNLVWAPGSPNATGIISTVTVNIAGASFTTQQMSGAAIILSGTVGAFSPLYLAPVGFIGLMTFINTYTVTSGDVSVYGSSGGTGQLLTAAKRQTVAFVSASLTYMVSQSP